MSIIERAVVKYGSEKALDQQGASVESTVVSAPRLSDNMYRERTADDTVVARTQDRIWRVQDRLRSIGMLVPGGLDSKFLDEYRRIKRPILANAFGKNADLVDRGNLILVTSAVPNEGKTYTAVNLALAIAQERDHTVLLVDCDAVKRDASRMVGLDDVPGLTDVLERDDLDLGDVMWRTDIPDLVLVPAGRPYDNVTELFASRKMSDLADELLSRYQDRVIIFDSPPLLATPQTAVLANLVGQVTVVVAAGKTPVAMVNDSLDLVPRDKAIGLVLNKVSGVLRRQPTQYHGYYDYGG